jgi:ABC-type nitrate/sulfonate/bicarbonate transport system permease component
MKPKLKNHISKFVKVLIGPLFIIIVWQLASVFELLEPSLLPGPLATFQTFFKIIYTGDILPDIRDTIFRMLIGYGFAALIGVSLGMFIGLYKPLYESFEGVIDFFRSIPVTTLYPVFILIFGIDHLSKIGMVFWSSFFVITLNSAYGVIQSSKMRTEVAKLYGANSFQIFRWITFYNALPQTLIGLRVAISFSIIVEILCEMFMGSEYGIGQRVTEAFTTYAISELYALIILSGLIGYLFNRIFIVLETKLVPWVGK